MNKNLSSENKETLVGEISKASLRLNQQIENLLNISRLESGHIAPKKDWVDINELTYEVVERVEENGKGRKIGVSINQNIPLCYTDKGMLYQIIYNLLNNAAIHTDPSCRIDVNVMSHADLLEIVIEDTGKGFTNAETKTVFKKFARENKSDNAGSGLGLSIVKGFTEALEGSVELQKNNPSGAKFTVTIPVKTSNMTIA